jgi:hypothetical protein
MKKGWTFANGQRPSVMCWLKERDKVTFKTLQTFVLRNGAYVVGTMCGLSGGIQYGERRHTYYLYWLYSFLEGPYWIPPDKPHIVPTTKDLRPQENCTVSKDSTCVDVRQYWIRFLEGVDLLSWVQCVVYREVSSTANVDTRTIFTDCTSPYWIPPDKPHIVPTTKDLRPQENCTVSKDSTCVDVRQYWIPLY